MLDMGHLTTENGQNIKITGFGNSIAFGSAPRREADSQPISQLVRQAVSQDSQSGKQAGRQKRTVWVLSVADSATSSRASSIYQNKQWSNGNAADHRRVGRWFDSRPADLSALPNLTVVQILLSTNF